MLYRPHTMFFDPEGNLYVPDRGNFAVHVYDREGAFLLRIGSQGSGPGEIVSLADAFLNEAGEVVVIDNRNLRRSFFSLAGEFLRSERLEMYEGTVIPGRPGMSPTVPGEYLRATNRDVLRNYGVLLQGDSPTGDSLLDLVEVVNAEGDILRSWCELIENDDFRVAVLLNRISLAYRPDGTVAVVYTYSPEITLYDYRTGELEMVITREIAFPPKEATLELEHSVSADGSTAVERWVPKADEISLSAAFDPEGRLWVLTRLLDQEASEAAESEGEWEGVLRLEIYDTDGDLQAVAPVDGRASVISFDPFGDLWILDTVESNTARRYSVIWP